MAELITKDLQYQLGSVLLGPGTPYIVQAVEGLDLPEMLTYDADLGGDDGEAPGEEYLPARFIIMDLAIHDDPPFPPTPQSMGPLNALFGPKRHGSQALVGFSFKFKGIPTLTCGVRPRRIGGPVNPMYHQGTVFRSLQLYAPRPFLYELVEISEEFNLASGATSMSRTFASNTIHEAPLVVDFLGPMRNPRLSHSQLGVAMRLDVDVPAGQTLTVDAMARTAILNGVNVYDKVRHDNEWWRVQPGSNTLTFSRSNTGLTGASAKATVRYRNVRLAV